MKSFRHSFFFVVLTLSLFLLWFLQKKVEISLEPKAHASVEKSSTLLYKRAKLNPSGEKDFRESVDHTHQGYFKEEQLQKIRSKLSFEQIAFCKIKNANTGISLSGNLKIVAFPYEIDEDEQPGFVAFVQSSECPENQFSKIRMDSLGSVKAVLDCQVKTKDEIALQSGIQGNIIDKNSAAKTQNFAISGNGFFITQCLDEFLLQRSGEFHVKEGILWHDSCKVLDRFGRPFLWDGGVLDEHGCNPNGSCIGIATSDPGASTIIDRTTIHNPDPFRNLMERPTIFSNALEDFSDPTSGPTGPMWEKLPSFIAPPNCVE